MALTGVLAAVKEKRERTGCGVLTWGELHRANVIGRDELEAMRWRAKRDVARLRDFERIERIAESEGYR